jgi:DNA-binding MarR family transcriptional regulator
MDGRQEPMGDDLALAALDKAFELAGRLGEQMGRTLAARGLSPARAEVIVTLSRSGPIHQRALSEALRCSARHVTTLVDALEAMGLVERRADPADRRAVRVTLTEAGEAAAARMDGERRAAARRLLAGVPPAELAAFVAVADRFLTIGG